MRTYISCYSCLYSTILTNAKDGKVIRCGLSGKVTKITSGMCYPSWCELYGFNHKRREQ